MEQVAQKPKKQRSEYRFFGSSQFFFIFCVFRGYFRHFKMLKSNPVFNLFILKVFCLTIEKISAIFAIQKNRAKPKNGFSVRCFLGFWATCSTALEKNVNYELCKIEFSIEWYKFYNKITYFWYTKGPWTENHFFVSVQFRVRALLSIKKPFS